MSQFIFYFIMFITIVTTLFLISLIGIILYDKYLNWQFKHLLKKVFKLTKETIELYKSKDMNQILIIFPFKEHGTWMFTDESVGLNHEPFIGNINKMIDILTKNIPDAEKGFKLTFSKDWFPNYQAIVAWVRAEGGGNIYQLFDPEILGGKEPIEGWLCPAMFKYFETAPTHMYLLAEPLK